MNVSLPLTLLTRLSSLQIPLTYLETVGPRHLVDLPARHLENRNLLALSALEEEVWHPKALGFPLRIRQVLRHLLAMLIFIHYVHMCVDIWQEISLGFLRE